LKSDPYRIPASAPDDNVGPSVPERGSRFIRFTLYAHLTAVVLTAIALAHDSAMWVWSNRWEPVLEVLLMIGLLGFIACPILLIVAVLRSSLSPARRLVVLCVGGGIAFAHFVALLPGVQ
tara:strand:- start:5312 stop:5671 length:360 start_codon:yes stop_codon:yes gene_type:complete